MTWTENSVRQMQLFVHSMWMENNIHNNSESNMIYVNFISQVESLIPGIWNSVPSHVTHAEL